VAKAIACNQQRLLHSFFSMSPVFCFYHQAEFGAIAAGPLRVNVIRPPGTSFRLDDGAVGIRGHVETVWTKQSEAQAQVNEGDATG